MVVRGVRRHCVKLRAFPGPSRTACPYPDPVRTWAGSSRTVTEQRRWECPLSGSDVTFTAGPPAVGRRRRGLRRARLPLRAGRQPRRCAPPPSPSATSTPRATGAASGSPGTSASTRTGRAADASRPREAPVSLGWWTNPFTGLGLTETRATIASSWGRSIGTLPKPGQRLHREVADDREHLRVAEDAGEPAVLVGADASRAAPPARRGPPATPRARTSARAGPRPAGRPRGRSRCPQVAGRRADVRARTHRASSTQSRTVSDQNDKSRAVSSNVAVRRLSRRQRPAW